MNPRARMARQLAIANLCDCICFGIFATGCALDELHGSFRPELFITALVWVAILCFIKHRYARVA
jgi:hypothetical protein